MLSSTQQAERCCHHGYRHPHHFAGGEIWAETLTDLLGVMS